MAFNIDSPIFQENFARFITSLKLESEAKVIDIGCGRGEFLVSVCETYGVTGIGLDKSSSRLKAAQTAKQRRCPEGKISFKNTDILIAEIPDKGSYDLAACIGAWYGFPGFSFLFDLACPGGLVVIGQPYWRKEPDGQYYAVLGRDESEESYRTLPEATHELLRTGCSLQYLFVSSQQEYDYYQSEIWRSRENEDIGKMIESRMLYTTWLREYHGWAIWVLKKPK